jgi:uracil DNA glycosylase
MQHVTWNAADWTVLTSLQMRKLTTVYATTVTLSWGKVAQDKTVVVTGTNDYH